MALLSDCATYMTDQEYQILGLGLAQLSEVVQRARGEEVSEIIGHFEEHVEFFCVIV